MDLLETYTNLLNCYTEQIIKLENLKAEHSKEHHIAWIPSAALNSKMFIYDEYLQNIYHAGFCYEEKNLIMPHLVQYLAKYEVSSEHDKIQLSDIKPKSQYQEALDNLIDKVFPFLDFHNSKLKELRELKYTFKIPVSPNKKNATRQLAQFQQDRAKYIEQNESLERCKKEIEERIKLFNEIKVSFQE